VKDVVGSGHKQLLDAPIGMLSEPRGERQPGQTAAQLADRPLLTSVEDGGVEPSAARGELCLSDGRSRPDSVACSPQPLRQPAGIRIVSLHEEQELHVRS
jgi:hypothetical protein